MLLRLKLLGALGTLMLTGVLLPVAIGGIGHGAARAQVCPPGTVSPTITASPTETPASPTASGEQTGLLTPTASPTSGTARSVTGTVQRISSVQQGTEMIYYVSLSGQSLVFTAPLSLSPQLPLVEVGDTVTGTYQQTGTGTAALLTFTDESLANPTATPTAGSTPTVTPTAGTPSPTPTVAATATATPSLTDTPTASTCGTGTGLASVTPTPAASAPTNQAPLGPGGSWTLRFADAFNGNGLDTTKWATCYPNFRVGSTDCTHDGGEQELYTPQNVSESRGVLTLTANKQDVQAGGQTFAYTSGMISSDPGTVGGNGGFAFTYGYAEMRAKIPAGQGLWPAFWLLPTDGSWPPEIDVFEFLGNAPTVDQMHYHYPGGGGDQAVGTAWIGPDFSAGWHTFGIDWEPGSLTWYVDGVVRFQTSTAVTNKPMYLIANLAVGGNWPGNPDASTPFPAAFQIDDIRVWQHA